MSNLDQAHHLRELSKKLPSGVFLKHGRKRTPPRIVSVVSGRGGVGKSFLALNIACLWALKGKKILLVDADYTMGHLDYLLGLNPNYTIQHLIEGKSDFNSTALDGPWGLKLIPGMSGVNGNPNLPVHFSQDIVKDLSMHDDWADVLLCDTTSGVSAPTVDIVSNSDELLLVTTPESGSVMDMYGMIKFLYQKLGSKMPRMRLIVNRVASRRDGRRVAASLRGVMGRFLGKGIHCIGTIPFDSEIDQASRKHVPFIRHAPTNQASRAIEEIALTLLHEWSDPLSPTSLND